MSLLVGPPGRTPRAVTPIDDSEAPVITAFTVSNGYDATHGASASLVIIGITLSASGDPTGFLITESPTPPAAGDVNLYPAPVSYTVTGSVTKYAHLYAWARDAAGNVSSAAEAFVLCYVCNASAIALDAVVDATHYTIAVGYDWSTSGQTNDWTAYDYTTLTVTGGNLQSRNTNVAGEIIRGMRWNFPIRVDKTEYQIRDAGTVYATFAWCCSEINSSVTNPPFNPNPGTSLCESAYWLDPESSVDGSTDRASTDLWGIVANTWYTFTAEFTDTLLSVTRSDLSPYTRVISRARTYDHYVGFGCWGVDSLTYGNADWSYINIYGTVVVT